MECGFVENPESSDGGGLIPIACESALRTQHLKSKSESCKGDLHQIKPDGRQKNSIGSRNDVLIPNWNRI